MLSGENEKFQYLIFLAERKNGKILDTSYAGMTGYYTWQCSSGHTWRAQANNIKQGRWCPVCANKKHGQYHKKDVKWLHQLASKKGGYCLSDIYINNSYKYQWKCGDCDHIWKSTAANISTGNWCPKCARKRIISKLILSNGNNSLIDVASIKSGECLSKHYVNMHTKYVWKCVSGHTWSASMSNVKAGNWCPYCRGCYKTVNDLIKLAKRNEGECLSGNYINNSTKYLWKCKDGHEWTATYGNISRGKWCPVCKESKGEKKIKEVLDRLNVKYCKEYRFEKCRNIKPLPFDFYLPDYNCCIEFDGEFHFNQGKGRKTDYQLQLKRDKIKTQYCEAANISLIRIPFTMIKSIESILKEEFEHGFALSRNYSEDLQICKNLR